MSRAVFLDRDGVLNRNVFYSDTGAYESPRTAAEFELFPHVIGALKLLIQAEYRLFLVSNQPNVAKGKSTLEDLQRTHEALKASLESNAILFEDFYYCYHHPESRVPELKGPCVCRKPAPYFLLKAEREHGIDLAQSWMIGDRATDIECGEAAGVRTIRVLPDFPCDDVRNQLPQPTFFAKDLHDAVIHILSIIEPRKCVA